MGWTPETIKELKRLWNKGFTTVEIGNRLGMSKNAIVGKAHRLGLESRPSPIKRELVKIQIPTPKPKAKPAPAPKKAEKKPAAQSKTVAQVPAPAPVSVPQEKAPKAQKTPATPKVQAPKAVAPNAASNKANAKPKVEQEEEISLVSAVPPVFEAEPLPEEKVAKKPNHKGVDLADLKPDSCRWPEGDPKDPDFRFCGEPCAPGKIYCEEHCAVAYTGVFKAR